MFGGTIGSWLLAKSGSTVRLEGGLIFPVFQFEQGSSLTLVGNNFQIDGAPAPGAGSSGAVLAALAPSSILTGTLSDGTHFAYPASRLPGNTFIQYAPVFGTPPTKTYLVPGDPPPQTLYAGQRLIVEAGGEAGSLHTTYGSVEILAGGSVTSRMATGATINVRGGRLVSAAPIDTGAAINLTAGQVDSRITAQSASVVNISGGVVTGDALLTDSTLIMSGGSIRSDVRLHSASIAEISGGEIFGSVSVGASSRLRMSDGYLWGGIGVDGSNPFERGGYAVVSGGSIRGLWGSAEMSGGVVRDYASTRTGERLSLVGGEFRIDGELVAGLEAAGGRLQVDIPKGSVVSGVFADGTPFMFSSSDVGYDLGFSGRGEGFANGSVTLVSAPLPAAGPSLVTASVDGAIGKLREGQTLIVDAADVIGDHVRAAHGSRIEIRPGGTVGEGLEATGTAVDIDGGSVGFGMDVSAGAVATVTSGSIAGRMDVIRGGVVRASGGTLGDNNAVHLGGVLEVSGASVGNWLQVHAGGRASMTTGTIGEHAYVQPGGELEITGGAVGDALLVGGTATFRGGRASGVRVERGELQLIDGQIDGLALESESHAIIAGGTVSSIALNRDALMELRGGVVERSLVVGSGGEFLMTGGVVEDDFTASNYSKAAFHGGSIGGTFQTAPSSDVSFYGGDFAVDGVPIQELNSPGATTLLQSFSSRSVLSGVLADGSPFALSRQDLDAIDGSALRLNVVELPAVGPPLIQVAAGVAPRSVRAGQTLIVEADGVIPKGFNAGAGATIELLEGATVGENFEATGAVVNMRGGELGRDADAFYGTIFNVSGGRVAGSLEAHHGGVINVSGGTTPESSEYYGPRGLVAKDGGEVNVSGGDIGGIIVESGGRASISGGSIAGRVNCQFSTRLDISGGIFEEDVLILNTITNVSGGVFAKHFHVWGGEFNLFVTDASLAGVAISDLAIGERRTLAARDVELSGRLAEGMTFALGLKSDPYAHAFQEYFSPYATVTVTRVFNPGDYNGDQLVDDRDRIIWTDAILSGNLAADGNYDGVVDDADLQVWTERFGRDYSAVPEPAALVLGLAGMLGLLSCTRRSAR